MECLHTLISKINNVHVYCISIVVCLETGINCCATVKYHFSMSRQNASFWSKVGEMGVGETGVGEQVPIY